MGFDELEDRGRPEVAEAAVEGIMGCWEDAIKAVGMVAEGRTRHTRAKVPVPRVRTTLKSEKQSLPDVLSGAAEDDELELLCDVGEVAVGDCVWACCCCACCAAA